MVLGGGVKLEFYVSYSQLILINLLDLHEQSCVNLNWNLYCVSLRSFLGAKVSYHVFLILNGILTMSVSIVKVFSYSKPNHTCQIHIISCSLFKGISFWLTIHRRERWSYFVWVYLSSAKHKNSTLSRFVAASSQMTSSRPIRTNLCT